MFLRKQFLLRVLALFLALNMLTQIVWPTVTYALTAGPTAPEATSFEPVDTTDMVNLLSGDFTYNMPLIEVPGPEGGYPLSLSYHAGIQPDEEASWVGLGWTLNPGAITRNVNGYADDHENTTGVIRDYWSGGERKSYDVGVTIGLGNSPASVSFGLSFSQDTYQGFGLGANMGVGMRLGGDKSPLNMGVSMGTDGYGNDYAGVNAGVGVPLSSGNTALSLGMGVGISTNFKSVNAGAGAGISVMSSGNGGKGMSHSLLGASINSSGAKPSLSVGGGKVSVSNGNAGKISTQSSGFHLDIPVYPGIAVGLGYTYTRYWSDETSVVKTNGMLYYPKDAPPATHTYFDNLAFDTYTLPHTSYNIVDNPDTEKVLGGSFPDFDNYMVSAQGVSGSIRPYMFQGTLYRQNKKKDSKYEVKQFRYGEGNKNPLVEYRFINDFSNALMQNQPDYLYNSTVPDDQFGAPIVDNKGYNAAKNHMAGSKHIEWFTNADIYAGRAKVEGLIDHSSEGALRSNDSQVGAFMITNESGVTYHFALPAYSYDEYVKTQNLSHENGLTSNTLSKGKRYAYTWYLTAITGPDFVDRGVVGKLDEADWGYWVKLDYGMWAHNYKWRNPAEGYHKDIDGTFGTFSTGKKEVYYLNTIATRTHTAIFEKEIRADAKGVSSNEKQMEGSTFTAYQASYETHYPSGCDPTATRDPYEQYDNSCDRTEWLFYNVFPAASLRLNKIYLLKNEHVPTGLAKLSNNYNHTFTYSDGVEQSYTEVVHTGQHVIDKYDIALAGQNFKEKAIRVIDFAFDYSLAFGTTNSFDPEGKLYASVIPAGIQDKKLGKLTLQQVKFLGLGGADLLPSTKFSYDLPAKPIAAALEKGSLLNAYILKESVPGELEAGDIVTFKQNNVAYYAMLKSWSGLTSGFLLKYIGEKYTGSAMTSIYVYKTKNPPYAKDHTDNWGLFNSNYNASVNTNIAKRTSNLSAKNMDVWSLRGITSPLGAKVNVEYEPDSYTNPVLHKASILKVNSVIPDNSTANGYKISFQDGISTEELTEVFNQGDAIDLSLLKLDKYFTQVYGTDPYTFVTHSCGTARSFLSKIVKAEAKVISISGGEVLVSSPELATALIQKANGVPLAEDSSMPVINCGTNHAPPDLKENRTYESTIVISGRVSLTKKSERKGGGIRVKSLRVRDVTGSENITSYNYNAPAGGKSSGVTTYEPSVSEQPKVIFPATEHFTAEDRAFRENGVILTTAQKKERSSNSVKKDLLLSFSKLFSINRELPGPGVMYEYVTVSNSIKHQDGAQFSKGGSTLYQFEVFKEDMIGVREFNKYTGGGYTSSLAERLQDPNTSTYLESFATKQTRNLAVSDFTSRVGTLKRVVYQGADGQKLKEVVSHYLHDQLLGKFENQTAEYQNRLYFHKNQGVVQERYSDARRVRRKDGEYDLLMVMSKREEYPVINTGTTTINYKTGVKETTENLAYDFYSGQVVRTLSKDSYGNSFLTVSVPAYHLYSAMGLKVNNPGNKQMLTQEGNSTTYNVTQAWKSNPVDANINGVLGASVQTWGNNSQVLGLGTADAQQNKIWRKQASYTWSPTGSSQDGLTPLGTYTAFKYDGTAQSPSWMKVGEISLYDMFSHALEAADVNGNYASTKMDNRQGKVLVSGAPARYSEVAFSGAENVNVANSGILDAGLTKGSGSISVGIAHTGQNSVLTTGQQTAFVYQASASGTGSSSTVGVGKAYTISAWAKGNVESARLYYSMNGGSKVVSAAPSKRAGDWYLLNLTIPATALVSGALLEVGCINQGTGSIYFDDFRFQPLQATVQSYVYDNLTGNLTHVLDPNNMFTRFAYDAMGRLISTYRETLEHGGEKLLAANQYHYAMFNSSAMAAISAATADATPVSAKTAQVRLIGLPNAFAPYKVTLDPGGRGAVTGVSVVQSVSAYTGSLSATSSPYNLVFTAPNQDVNVHNPFSTFSLAYQNGGTYWIKIRVEDAIGNHREMVQKVVVQN